MTVFEDIVEANYEEPTEEVLEWLDGSEDSAPHDHDNATHVVPPEDSTLPLLFSPHHDLDTDRQVPSTDTAGSYEDLAKHCSYISSLHNELLNLDDPQKRAHCVETLAGALLEFSLPDVWKVAKDIGELNAPQLLYIMQSWLDHSPVDHPWRRRVLYLLVKMAAANQALPKQLFLDGVFFDDVQHPWMSGGFADIFKGTFQGIKVVGKRIRVYSVDKIVLHSTICNETLVWKQLKHPSILPFFGLDRRSWGPTETLYLVSPLMRCTLWDFITKATDYHAHDDLYRLLWEVSDGLSYLHAAKVVHGDINNSNILISDDRRAQIADFGLTIVGDATVGRMSTRNAHYGTTRWMSPERFQNETKRLARSDDVYAFGGLVYMMFSHKLPWNGLSDLAVYTQVMRGSLPGLRLDCTTPSGMSIPDEAWRLVEACWSIDAGLRPDLPHIQKIVTMLKESPATSTAGRTDRIITQASHNQSMDTSTGTPAKSIPALFTDNTPSLANSTTPSTSGPSRIYSLRGRQYRRQSPSRSPSCSLSPPFPPMGLNSLGESDDDEGVTGGY